MQQHPEIVGQVAQRAGGHRHRALADEQVAQVDEVLALADQPPAAVQGSRLRWPARSGCWAITYSTKST
jgi:hypothetical protein